MMYPSFRAIVQRDISIHPHEVVRNIQQYYIYVVGLRLNIVV
jgi:hypothetical protein